MSGIVAILIETGLVFLFIPVVVLIIWQIHRRIKSKKENKKFTKNDGTENVLSKIQVKFYDYEFDRRNTSNFSIEIDSWKDICTIILKPRNWTNDYTTKYSDFKSRFYNRSISLNSIHNRLRRSYFDALLYDIIVDFTNKRISYKEFIDSSIDIINRFNAVEDYGFELYGTNSFIGFYRFVGEYQILAELIKSECYRFDFSFIHEIELNTKSKQINTATLIYLCGMKHLLNTYTIQNLGDFCEFVDKEINNIYGENFSFFKALFEKDGDINEIMNEFPDGATKSKSYYYSKKSEEPIVSYLAVRNKFPKKCKEFAFNGLSRLFVHPRREFPTFNLMMEGLIQEIFSSVVLSNENKFRVSRGIPKIGEGWVSETNLYYLIKRRFSDIEIIHHGRPRWLGNQHVDIWLPEYQIGVEYHGKQHFEAVEFFGGYKGLLKTQERDERKRLLFKDNNAYLIEVENGYDIDLVYEEIENHISRLNSEYDIL